MISAPKVHLSLKSVCPGLGALIQLVPGNVAIAIIFGLKIKDLQLQISCKLSSQ